MRLFIRHFLLTLLLLASTLVCFGLLIGAEAHLFEDEKAYQLDGETHVFFQPYSAPVSGQPATEQLVASTIRGDQDSGFWIEMQPLSAEEGGVQLQIPFPADGSSFQVTVQSQIETPASQYQDGEAVIALSDLEGGFAAFRQFLQAHGIADAGLNWTFGKGHLVLVGDMTDRGASVTPLLWAIYQLEQSARAAGGQVHYILGNHEIKNLQGNFQSAHEKYFYIAGMLGRQQAELFGDGALLGRWLASKNVLEVINGVAFVHGGLHPQLADKQLTVAELNQKVRAGYRTLYYSPRTASLDAFLRSSTTGPAWYRGYFKEALTQSQIDQSLAAVGAQAMVVGHTLQSEVTVLHQQKVFAIDVRHPKDYLFSLPFRRSEGLLLKNGRFFRLTADGEMTAL